MKNSELYYFYSYIHMENNQVCAQSMYLSTMPNLKKSFVFAKSPLDISDIKGARSRYLQYPKPQRDNPLHPYDLQKSHPRQLIPQTVNKTSYCLVVDDIQGTRTKINKFTTTRQTNPLIPNYQSPKVQYILPQQPKFIRDNMAIDDIEGVRSKETFAIKMERKGKIINTKQQLVSNIKPIQKGFTRTDTINYSLFADDINKKQESGLGKHKRVTNPLDPAYNVSGQLNYGFIQGSKTTNTNMKLVKPFSSLATEDIQGAKPKYNNFVSEKKEQIIGSKAQTLKRGVSTNRKTDPLNPKYEYPGWSENTQKCSFTRPKTAHQRFDQFIK